MQDHPSSSILSSNPPDAGARKAYWREQGQSWRSEPIIDEERQQQLMRYSQGGIDIERGRYPFKGVRLSREAIIGLTIEISFIATFTQGYYGK